jgi:hypothetical protein
MDEKETFTSLQLARLEISSCMIETNERNIQP